MRIRLLFATLALLLQAPLIFADEEVPMAPLTFVVDDVDRVEISVTGEALTNLQNGSNTVDVMQWSNVAISPKAGCSIKSVTNSQGQEMTINNGEVTFMVYEATPETYTIVSEKNSVISFTIDVDDPSKVSVVDKNYQPVNLNAGVNEMEMSELNLPLIIGTPVYGQELYKVLLDNEEIQPYYGSYAVSPKNNSVIKIEANFPDIDCTVDFQYPAEISTFFTCIKVNDETEKSVADNAIDVKCGDKVALYYNPSCWDTEETPIVVKINGKEADWFYPGYSFTVKENTVVEVIQAAAAQMITVNVEVDNPANIVLYRVDKDYKDVIALSKGNNTVELPQEDANLVITNVQEGDDESKITGVTINGTPKSVPYYNEIELKNLDADDAIKVFTEGNFGEVTPSEPEITVDPESGSSLNTINSITFYLEAEWDYGYDDDLFDVKNEEGIYFTLNGKRYCNATANLDVETVQFVPAELIYKAGEYQLVIEKNALAWIREDGGDFVANDEPMVFTYNVSGVNTDIDEIPVNLDPAPGSTVSSLQWTMTMAEGYDELDVADMMVYIYKDGQKLCGVIVEPSDDYTSAVITPEEEVNEEGDYELIFAAGAVYCDGDEYYYNLEPLVFPYTLKAEDSIISIETSTTTVTGVYNLQGIRVADTTDNLPAGLYIVNGQKVYIK